MTAPQTRSAFATAGMIAPDNAIARRCAGSALVSIVVAFYNEEKTIDALFSELQRAVGQMRCRVEYVCVNDGSRDRTLALLRDKMRSIPAIRVIDLARNFGKEAAMTAGLAQARGDAVILIDADLQDPPALMPAFVAKWREGYDVVYGIRASRRADGAMKRWTARAFYALFDTLTDVRIPAGAGDFRLLDRRAVDALLALPERNRFMKGLFSWIGFRQTGVAFVRDARVAGATKWSYWRLANFAVDGLTSFSIAPLRIASLAGVLASLIGFCYAAFLVVRTLVYGADVPGYASLMVVMMVLGGAQLLCLGLVGEYLGRLYVEAKGRPLYLVSDIISSAADIDSAAPCDGAETPDEDAPDKSMTEMQPWDRRF
jgi:glycosyltransferase involved in cell wall biosynthesis